MHVPGPVLQLVNEKELRIAAPSRFTQAQSQILNSPES
jgi:hypothetical protein